MPNVEIYDKARKKWLTADQIDNLLYDSLHKSELEWEVSKGHSRKKMRSVS